MANPKEIPSMLKGLFLNHHFYYVWWKALWYFAFLLVVFSKKPQCWQKFLQRVTGRRNAIKQFQIKQKSRIFFREMHILFNPPFNWFFTVATLPTRNSWPRIALLKKTSAKRLQNNIGKITFWASIKLRLCMTQRRKNGTIFRNLAKSVKSNGISVCVYSYRGQLFLRACQKASNLAEKLSMSPPQFPTYFSLYYLDWDWH